MYKKSFMKLIFIGCILMTGICMAVEPLKTSKLSEPVKLKSGDGFVDSEIGHPDMFVMDWNSDGKKDLLVGQFGGGKLRIYINKGTDAAPKFENFEFLKAGEAEASVPSG